MECKKFKKATSNSDMKVSEIFASARRGTTNKKLLELTPKSPFPTL